MRTRLPSLNALRFFESAARLASFKSAARELCVSRSAVSHQVKKLEQQLGVKLFLRKASVVELTRVGRAYYPILREAFDRISEGTEMVLSPTGRNIITIQIYSTFAIRWLIPRMPQLQQQHPQIMVRLHASQSDVDFDHDDVDMCVMIGAPNRADLQYDYLFSSRVFPVCNPVYMAGLDLFGHPERLCDAEILQVYPSRLDWWVWLQDNNIEGVDPDSGQQFDSYDHAMNAAMQGMGVALGIEPFVVRDLEAGLLIKPFPKRKVYTKGDWYLVCREEKAGNTDIEIFRHWLIEQIKADPTMPPRRA
jgi:LysR family glycine cleavage system transcriptional activator